MKVYNNSQKTPQSDHYTKWNETVKHLVKNEGIHSKYNRQRLAGAASDMAGKNTPNSSTRLQRKVPHTKYSSRQLIYTKATRIFLQHQILTLHSFDFERSLGESSSSSHREQNWRGLIIRAYFGRESQ